MGWFGKNVDVAITEVENPFPIGDSLIKGQFEIHAKKKDCIIKQYYLRFFVKHETDGSYDEYELGDEHSKHIDDDDFVLPYTLKAGERKEVAYFVDLDQTIAEVLKTEGLKKKDKHLEYVLQCDIAVKGSLVDDKTKVQVKVVDGKSD